MVGEEEEIVETDLAVAVEIGRSGDRSGGGDQGVFILYPSTSNNPMEGGSTWLMNRG